MTELKRTYTLNTPQGVRTLLRDRGAISALRFAGDTDASAIVTDLNTAIDRARLSRRQAEAITYVYGCDLTQEAAATEMSVTRDAVNAFIREASGKIARIYRAWDYGDVDVMVNVVIDAATESNAEGADKIE